MLFTTPDYYDDFRCIAGDCRDSCCIGWEIDIDADTLGFYEQVQGCFGQRLHDNIQEGCFRLDAQELCPFLNRAGLCDIYTRLGEEHLCQICTDHPRFRNFWSDRIEIGLGLACEEAARLILTSPHPLRLVPLEDTEEPREAPSEAETALLTCRDRLLASVSETGPAARLREYLIYRHLADALYDGRVAERLRLVDRAYAQITAGWDGRSVADLAERARVFSNEVEYDDEKLEQLLTEA